MDNWNIIIDTCLAVFAGVGGFVAGKKKSDADATRTAFEAYNVALESLRNEIKKTTERWNEIRGELERKIDEQGERISELEMEKENASLKINEQGKRISELEKENASLKIQIEKLG